MTTPSGKRSSADSAPYSSRHSATDHVRQKLFWLLAIGLFIGSPLLAIGFGTTAIGFSESLQALGCRLGLECQLPAITERIVIDLRLPRSLLALSAGAGLALAGAILQTVTRNPLADPYLFGISSGASFGAVLVIAAVGTGIGSGASSLMTGMGVTAGAFIGAAAAMVIVLAMAGNGIQIERMLLAGVAASFMFNAATSLTLYSADAEAVASWLFWTLGSFQRAQWQTLWIPALVASVSLIGFCLYARPLQVLLAGDESAKTLGVNAAKIRIIALLVSSLITATTVAFCGGIGFVGLMIPHLVRKLTYTGQARQLLLIALCGGIFMVWVDVLAKQLLDNRELPIGIMTAAVGSLFFLMLLRAKRWRQ